MKKLAFLLILLLCNNAWSIAQVDTLSNTILNPVQLNEDFDLYRRMLQETHPGLYRYTPKAIIQDRLDSISALLNQPMAFYDFYKLLAAFNAGIKCAHSTVLPTNDFNLYFYKKVKSFPFFIYPILGRYFVVFNGTKGDTVKPGYELSYINGQSMDNIARQMKKYFWVDGNIEKSKNSNLRGGAFAFFYYTLVARPESFNLVFKDLNGESMEINVPAQLFSTTNRNFVKNPINKKMLRLYNKKNKKPWSLEFPKDPKSTAILSVYAFGGKGMNNEKEAQIAIQNFMDKALKKIKRKDVQHLIVDVRGNGGGWDIQGVELFTYLMNSNKPVKYYQRQYAINDKSEFLAYSDLSEEDQQNIRLRAEKDGTFSLMEEENPTLKRQFPKPNRFKGNLYILMNEGSFSTTAEFLAVSKSNRIGILVGEESGGAYEGGNGGSFIHMTLPNSKIEIGSPLVYYQNAVKPVEPKGRGTMPDYFVSTEPEDLLTGYDRQLAFVKDLIRKMK